MYTKSHLYKLYKNAVEKSNNNRKDNPFNNDNDDNLSLALLTHHLLQNNILHMNHLKLVKLLRIGEELAQKTIQQLKKGN